MTNNLESKRTLLGFDHGRRHIGIAVGQEVTANAAPLGALRAQDGIPNWDEVSALISEWRPDEIVVGLPLNMDGSNQQVTASAKKFGNRLKGRYGINVSFHDERLTTVDAKARLFELGGFKRLKKDQIDSVSAVLILESYMESLYS